MGQLEKYIAKKTVCLSKGDTINKRVEYMGLLTIYMGLLKNAKYFFTYRYKKYMGQLKMYVYPKDLLYKKEYNIWASWKNIWAS